MDVTGRPGARRRSAPAEKALALRAIELGWERAGGTTPAQQVFLRRATASTILADLATLVDAAAEMKWALARLRVEHGQTTRRGIVVTATFERRLEAAIGAAIRASVPRRRAAGVRFGRRPLIPDTVLAQIVREREAGTSYSRIAAELQAAGVPTAQGGLKWRASTVRAAYLRASEAAHD